MPSFSFLNEEQTESIYRYLGGTRDGSVVQRPDGPIVASGGIPGSQNFRPAEESAGWRGLKDYPEGTDTPDIRYYLDGWGLGYSHVVAPPWTSIIAYDLNEGTIKWKRPLGTDKTAAEQGAVDTGVPGAARNAMIVTSSGVLFSTAGDSKVYAFDAETGEELWSANLPLRTEGIPAMYEIDGKPYLVVTAATQAEDEDEDSEENQPQDKPQGGYKVFSLPD